MKKPDDWTQRTDAKFLLIFGWICVAVVLIAFWAIDPLGWFTAGIDPDIGSRYFGAGDWLSPSP